MTYQTRKHLDKTKIFSFFLEFDFCRFCVVVRFFHPRHNGQWPPTLNDFYTRSNPLHYFPILILLKEPVFPFSMLSAKQGNYWYHFYNVFDMTRSLTGDWTWDIPHSKPALYHQAIEEAVKIKRKYISNISHARGMSIDRRTMSPCISEIYFSNLLKIAFWFCNLKNISQCGLINMLCSWARYYPLYIQHWF